MADNTRRPSYYILAALSLICAASISSCAKPRNPQLYLYEEKPSSSSAATSQDASNGSAESEPAPELRKKAIPDGFGKYYDTNPDLVGWLSIAGLDVPVVQGRDNDEYLTKNFDGTEARYSETVFADFRCDLSDPSPQNMILYSHNLQSGDGFARIAKYYPWYGSQSGSTYFYRENPIIEYSDFYGNGEPERYAIFAAAYLTMDKSDPYFVDFSSYMSISDKAEFTDFAVAMLDRSVFYNDSIDIGYGDRIIALSTCLSLLGDAYDTRFVVFAKLLSEDDDFDPGSMEINPDPLYFKVYHDMMGTEWGGRDWDPGLIRY